MGRPLTGARCQTTASATELGWRYTLGQPFGRAPSQPALGSSVQVQKRLRLGGISNKSIWTYPPSATLPFTVHPSNPIRHRRLSRDHSTQAADGQYHGVDFAPLATRFRNCIGLALSRRSTSTVVSAHLSSSSCHAIARRDCEHLPTHLGPADSESSGRRPGWTSREPEARVGPPRRERCRMPPPGRVAP